MGKWRTPASEPDKQRINEQIHVTPVRVIGSDGTQLGILPTEEAIQEARKADLDLVEVAPQERPPVCRIMDYGKYKYQQKKRQHKGHTHQTKIKEIRLRPNIEDHDLEVKEKRVREFLGNGAKVKISVAFRGREITHREFGKEVLDKLAGKLEDVGTVEMEARMIGRFMNIVIAPIKS